MSDEKISRIASVPMASIYNTRSQPDKGETTEVQGNSDFHEAITAAPLDALSRTSLQLYAILLVAALNATASGFDGSIFSSINAMSQYKNYFHHRELGSATGIIFMIYTIGNMVGSLFTGPICDHFGRRAGMATGSVLIIAGSAILTAARDDSYLLSAKYHGGGHMDHPMVKLELREFEESIKVQKAQSWWNYWDLVENHNARWRFLMNAFMSFFAQMTGNSVLTYYLPSMYGAYKNIPCEGPNVRSCAFSSTLCFIVILTDFWNSIVSTERRLLLTFAASIVSCVGAIVGSATNDWIGRRTKLWVGSIVLACLFGAVTGFSSPFDNGENPSASISNAGVAMIFLFGIVYSFVYTPLTATYCAKVQNNHTRAKGMGVHVIISNCANLYNTYVTVVALEAVSWRYYFLFVGFNLIYAVVWFFLGVETHGRTLEELDAVFDSKWPPQAALAKSVMIKQEDGHLRGVGSPA